MSIEFDIELTPGYVVVRCSGMFDLASALQVYDAAFGAAEREGKPAALIDAFGIEGDLPTAIDRFSMGARIAEHRTKGVRLAVAGQWGLIDPARLGETVAVNRGAQVKVFGDLDAARQWLEAPDASPMDA